MEEYLNELYDRFSFDKLFRNLLNQYYFEKTFTKAKAPIKVTKKVLNELGERLYGKSKEVVIPEWTEAFKEITKQDCFDYVNKVTIPRTYDGFVTEKSVINDFLAKKFPDIQFVESDPDLDHSGDIDYIGKVGSKAFGIQIKPITANANFGNYKVSERMQANFQQFEEKYGGKVFIVFSYKAGDKKEVKNKEVLIEIAAEIERLKNL